MESKMFKTQRKRFTKIVYQLYFYRYLDSMLSMVDFGFQRTVWCHSISDLIFQAIWVLSPSHFWATGNLQSMSDRCSLTSENLEKWKVLVVNQGCLSGCWVIAAGHQEPEDIDLSSVWRELFSKLSSAWSFGLNIFQLQTEFKVRDRSEREYSVSGIHPWRQKVLQQFGYSHPDHKRNRIGIKFRLAGLSAQYFCPFCYDI
jgi:hypothetical protein